MVPKILRRHSVEQLIGLSCSSIYSMMARGDFPKPIKIGRRAVGWREQDIKEWLENLQGQSDDKEHNNESTDEYAAIIMQIDSRTRVIRCRHDLQWIMQKRTSPDLNKGYWIGLGYHTTWESLIKHYSGLREALNASFQTNAAREEEVYLDVTDGQD